MEMYEIQGNRSWQNGQLNSYVCEALRFMATSYLPIFDEYDHCTVSRTRHDILSRAAIVASRVEEFRP